MRNELTTGRRRAVVVALLLLALFVLHPACPPEPAHHGAFVPGHSQDFSAELCHHGETHHQVASTVTQAAVQTSAFSLADLGTDVVAAARPDVVHRSCQWRLEPARSGRELLLGIGISRT